MMAQNGWQGGDMKEAKSEMAQWNLQCNDRGRTVTGNQQAVMNILISTM
jgi:hypothetical protein